MRTWTLDQIKVAFWEEFHKSGELWFDYFDGTQESGVVTVGKEVHRGSEQDCEGCTEEYWRTFKEHLTEQKP